MNKGKLIVFEGPDFCGKSTQIKLIMQNLKNNMVLYTREPGSFLPESKEQCEKLRNELLNTQCNKYKEAILFAASRFYHTMEIVDLINKGYNIICDRYIISSLAYQGYAQELGCDGIYAVNESALDLLKENQVPIYCFRFKLPKEVWLERKNKRLNDYSADSIESKDIHDEVFEFYNNDRIFEDYTNKLHLFTHNVDASLSIEEMHEYIMKYINILIK